MPAKIVKDAWNAKWEEQFYDFACTRYLYSLFEFPIILSIHSASLHSDVFFRRLASAVSTSRLPVLASLLWQRVYVNRRFPDAKGFPPVPLPSCAYQGLVLFSFLPCTHHNVRKLDCLSLQNRTRDNGCGTHPFQMHIPTWLGFSPHNAFFAHHRPMRSTPANRNGDAGW